MTILAYIGFYMVMLISFSLIIGGLLNLGGCGDRVGDKYRFSNYTQIVIGVLLGISLCFV